MASGPAAAPTRAVVSATVKVVCSVLIEPTAPTRRMSLNRVGRSRAKRSRTRLRPDPIYQASTAAVSAVVRMTATPAPAIPSAGIAPKPKISSGESGISRTTPIQVASEGTSMLPVPRMALANAFISHTKPLPANTTFE
jgi:hypothetical protein